MTSRSIEDDKSLVAIDTLLQMVVGRAQCVDVQFGHHEYAMDYNEPVLRRMMRSPGERRVIHFTVEIRERIGGVLCDKSSIIVSINDSQLKLAQKMTRDWQIENTERIACQWMELAQQAMTLKKRGM